MYAKQLSPEAFAGISPRACAAAAAASDRNRRAGRADLHGADRVACGDPKLAVGPADVEVLFDQQLLQFRGLFGGHRRDRAGVIAPGRACRVAAM